MNQAADLFPETYQASRERFRQNLPRVRERWPEARLNCHSLAGKEDLTIDWIECPAAEQQKKAFLLTTGEHGIECYVGSAMQQRFIDSFLPQLNPADTGLLFVHAINPWGMQHHRRVNASNVDLNRNFLWDRTGFSRDVNPTYDRVDALLNPPEQLQGLLKSRLKHISGLLASLSRLGAKGFRTASLVGQYRYPHGLYYGGLDYQEETRILIDLYRSSLQRYDQVLHLDMHTGYGPRYQMSLVNSVHETRPSAEFSSRFDYPLVVAANPDEFYAIQGDMVDFYYQLWRHEFPQKRFYSAAFEFGTIGEVLKGWVHCPLAMVLENQLYWHGAKNTSIQVQVSSMFEELFNPGEDRWREKALSDADRAFRGILRAEGYY